MARRGYSRYLEGMQTQCASWPSSPTLPIRIDRLALDGSREISVLRDDLLPAGTKQRAVLPFLEELLQSGVRRVTYASPFAGFAQVALAYGCHALGIECTLYCERDPAQAGLQAHRFTQLASSWGAKIHLRKDLLEAENSAEAEGAFKIPLGFQCREFQRHFQAAIAEIFSAMLRGRGPQPRAVWLPLGSGTLAHAVCRIAPPAMQLRCVNVHVLPASDLRIQSLRSLKRVQYFEAEEEFAEAAVELPPLPSNLHYDAKLWRFLHQHAEPGDFWWNVAR